MVAPKGSVAIRFSGCPHTKVFAPWPQFLSPNSQGEFEGVGAVWTVFWVPATKKMRSEKKKLGHVFSWFVGPYVLIQFFGTIVGGKGDHPKFWETPKHPQFFLGPIHHPNQPWSFVQISQNSFPAKMPFCSQGSPFFIFHPEIFGRLCSNWMSVWKRKWCHFQLSCSPVQ